MFREITIGNKKVPMIANGATPLRYKLLFGKDLITEFQNANGDSSKVVECIPELAFIMAKAAEAKEGKTDMALLNKESYINWLEDFDSFEIPMATEEIIDLYMGNALTTAEPKKKDSARQKEN